MILRCPKCTWSGEQDTETCPKCGERASETLSDIENAENLYIKYGERFRNYYLFKTFKRMESLPLGVGDLTQEFNIYEYSVQFVTPGTVMLKEGFINYSNGERQLGIFRFPRLPTGEFLSPFSKDIDMSVLNSMKAEDLDKILGLPRPLVFEAFRIPHHTFQYSSIDDVAYEKIVGACGEKHAELYKSKHGAALQETLEKIAAKIARGPNFLLILENVLCSRRSDFEAVALETENIIHIA